MFMKWMMEARWNVCEKCVVQQKMIKLLTHVDVLRNLVVWT